MGYQHWHFTKDKEGTAWLEIDVKDSSVNILRAEVMQEWAEIMKEVAADSSLTGLCMVSGKPGGFVYGADIAEFNTLASEADVHNLIALAASVLLAIEKLDIPTVCGIDGVANFFLRPHRDQMQDLWVMLNSAANVLSLILRASGAQIISATLMTIIFGLDSLCVLINPVIIWRARTNHVELKEL